MGEDQVNRRELLKRIGQGCAAAVAAVVGVRSKSLVNPKPKTWVVSCCSSVVLSIPVDYRTYTVTPTKFRRIGEILS